MYKRRQKTAIGLFEIVCLIVIIVSFSSIILLVLNKFNPFVATSVAAFVLLAVFLRYKDAFSLTKVLTKTNMMLFLILLLALVPRYKPHLYLYADVHDQAHYLIMSEMYAYTGSTFILDHVASKINDTELQNYYEMQNNIAPESGHRSWGIHLQDGERFAYEFRFYPLHSLWISIFSRFFGDANRVYSLTLFSLISIIAFFLIALELSGGNIKAAAVVGLIFAVSDQHIFFSKSPVSEITYLAFIASSLYFLLKYYKSSLAHHQNSFYLFLSAGLIGCAVFTRITSFIYVAFFYILAILTIIYLQKIKYKKNLLIYFALIFSIYALSLLYGKYYSHRYFLDIIETGFARRILGDNWRNIWHFAIAGMIGFLFVLNYISSKTGIILKRTKEILAKNRAHLLFTAFCFIIIYMISKSIQKEYTLGEGLIKFFPISFALVFFPALVIYSWKNFESFAVFLLLAVLSFAMLPVGAPLDQTYSRYILDILAFIFLMCSLFIWEMMSKTHYKIIKIAGILLLMLVMFQFVHNLQQYEKIKHTDSIHDEFAKLLKPVTQEDLLVVDKEHFPLFELRNVLDYYFHLNVFAVAKLQDIEKLADYMHNYESTFILTQQEISENDKAPVSSANITQTTFNWTRGHPYEVSDLKIQLYLYKLQK